MRKVVPPRRAPADEYSLLFSATFGSGDMAAIRHRVAEALLGLGFGPEATDRLVIAVNEVMTNAVRHGGGTGRLHVWADGDVVCEIDDEGTGCASQPYVGRVDRPASTPTGGLGLWIAQQTTDDMSIDSGPSGTTVKLTVDRGGAGRTG